MPPGSDPSYRITMFGGGLGVLTFYVHDQAELIRVFDIAWPLMTFSGRHKGGAWPSHGRAAS
jgi:hypothetical protein